MVGKALGHYQIIEKLGEGGMGVVYKARDTHLDRFVAVKVLPPEKVTDPERKRRFVQEAKSASALNHPNIVHVYDIDQCNGIDFIAMEYVEGKTLSERIGHRGLRLNDALKYSVQIADALAKAHSAGIVHRDLKPTNIMVNEDDLVKVLDFGLAKLTEQSESGEAASTVTIDAQGKPITEKGAIVGTVAYMSPEQAEGRKVDARSDIFSLGSVLYEMATGQKAFQGPSKISTLSAILHKEPKPPSAIAPAIPSDLEKLISRCLRKDQAKRFQHMDDVKVALEELKEDSESGKLRARTSSRRHSLRWLIAGSALLAVLALSGALIYWPTPREQIDSLAVLPFVNAASDPDSESLSDGITESLIISLSRLPELKVKSRDTISRYKREQKDAQTAGRDLGVRTIVKGGMLRHGDSLSITVELVDSSDGTVLWSNRYDRPMRDILTVQDEISREISERLRPRLSWDESKRVTKSQTESTEAYQFYLMGRYRWNRRTEETLRASAECFQQAIEKDPTYARAWAGLADAFNLIGTYGVQSASQIFPRARTAATRALELDPSLAEPHASLGWFKSQFEWDWEGSEREYQRAIKLNPEYATAYHWRAWLFSIMGRAAESVESIRQARDLDPTSPVIHSRVGLFLYFAHRYDEAVEESRKSIEMDPTFAWGHSCLGSTYMQTGRHADGITELEKALRLSERGRIEMSYLGHAYAIAGRQADARKLLAELNDLSARSYVPPIYPAIIRAGLGEKDAALELLAKAYADRSLPSWYLPDPRLDPLRSDPRFEDTLRGMGLGKSR